MSNDEPPRLSRGQAKRVARLILDDPQHAHRPDHTGHDPRDERTREQRLDDPALSIAPDPAVPEPPTQDEE